MAELSARRLVLIAGVVGAVVGGAVAGAVTEVSSSGTPGGAAGTGSAGSVSTVAVVRTTLSSEQQVGGSIGFGGSYTIAAPSGESAQQLSQAQQAVTMDQQALSADQQSETDDSTADSQTVAVDQSNIRAAQSSLGSDQAAQALDCAGAGASSPACGQDTQKVSQDQAQLTQAQQQLAAAQTSATTHHDQNQSKVSSDQTKLQADQTTLTTDKASAVTPGTTYTSLPATGDVIKEDQPVYAVSDQPVPLLYGSITAYRAFYIGMSDGPDVGQLTHDLIALGDGTGLAQSNHFSSATEAAVKRWQSSIGMLSTGQLLLGQVVFEPGPIRVTSVTPSVGQSYGGGGGGGGAGAGGGGTVLTATSTTPIVTVDLPVTEEYLVKPGDAVSVVLPSGTSTVGGHIETVGSVAICPGGGGAGTGAGASPGSGSADQSPCESAGSGNQSTPTVLLTITLNSTPPGATLDQAPVNVNITSHTANDVLAVPVNALLALQGGGFGVEVVSGSSSHLVGVTTGLYDNTLVQISGSGISVGMRVQVPSS